MRRTALGRRAGLVAAAGGAAVLVVVWPLWAIADCPPAQRAWVQEAARATGPRLTARTADWRPLCEEVERSVPLTEVAAVTPPAIRSFWLPCDRGRVGVRLVRVDRGEIDRPPTPPAGTAPPGRAP